jgi:hypothetical protein
MEGAMSDYDSPWKEALDVYFEAFLLFFFPRVHADIDWSRRWESLDKELQQVVRDAELGRRYADMLVKVWLRDGRECWLLIRVEVQGRFEADFARRIYVYNYRIFDRYNHEVVSLVVLADDDPGWRPRTFWQGRWGCRSGIEFESVKLLDYAGREASDNPFAKVVPAHLKTLETRGKDADRHAWKVRLVRNLYECGLGAQDVRELFRLIDWMMELPPALGALFWEEVKEIQKEKHMPFITTPERIGMEKGMKEGMEKGMKEGRREGLLLGVEEVLRTNFGEEGVRLMPEIQALDDAEKIKAVLRAALIAASIDEVRRVWS